MRVTPPTPPRFEVSPREKADEAERDRREFDDEDVPPNEAWIRETLAGRDEYRGP